MSHFPDTATGLPDPLTHPEFYRDVAFKRALAWLIDSLLISLLVAVIVVLTLGIGLFFFWFLYLGVGFAYRVASISAHSATPGMWLMAIELREADGARLAPATALLHTLGYTFSVAFVMPQVLSVVLMVLTPRGQGLSDLFLGTAMINRPARL